MRQVAIFLCCASLLLCLVSGPAYAVYTFKPDAEPDGFRGIKWGAALKDLKDMVPAPADPAMKNVERYTRKADRMKMGEATILSVHYLFWRGRFMGAVVTATGNRNWLGLREAVFDRFGEGDQPNPYKEYYTWEGYRSSMVLQYNRVTDTCELWLSSIEIAAEAEKDGGKTKEKDAGADF